MDWEVLIRRFKSFGPNSVKRPEMKDQLESKSSSSSFKKTTSLAGLVIGQIFKRDFIS